MMSVIQPWVSQLPLSMQTVLLTAIRGPDGCPKDCPAKVIVRAVRRCILISARSKITLALLEPGGGEFMRPMPFVDPSGHATAEEASIRLHVRSYFATTDELPHHFQMHLLHAAQIIGYYHPVFDQDGRDKRWLGLHFYEAGVNDMHLEPEPLEVMQARYASIDNG